MINHAHSLLYNRDNTSVFYIPPAPSFVVQSYSPLIEAARGILFGGDPSEHSIFVAARVVQILKLLHSYPYNEYLDALDPRVTYDISTLDYNSLVSVSTQTASDVTVNFIGSPMASSAVGKAKYTWSITTSAGGVVTAATGADTATTNVTTTDGTTSKFSLPGISNKATLSFASGAFESGVSISYEHIMPMPDLSLSLLTSVMNACTLRIFDTIPSGSTFRDFYGSSLYPVKWAGVLLAIIYQMSYEYVTS